MLKVILKKNEEERILKGHPWIFSNEVESFEGSIVSGEICEVYSEHHQFIGKGFFNANSKIMVRMLTLKDVEIDEPFFENRIQEAWQYRKTIGFTSSCRVIFSEADLLPGLIVDKYQEYLSIQILSLGMERIKDMLIRVLVRLFHPLGIYERSDTPIREKEGLKPWKGRVYGTFSPIITIEENGIFIQVDLENGQKTGYFLDQRLNRATLKNYVQDKVVLDCFSHTGGFSLHAAKYGAKKVVAVDISEKACMDVKKNSELNHFTQIVPICQDVFDFLHQKENEQQFDVIILDPPAFTKSKDTIKKAYRGYKEINLQALKIIKKGGFLLTFSCSQHMSPALFLQMIEEACIDSKRKVQMIDFRIQSLDHPTLLCSFESFYLKCVILHILD